MAQTKDKTMFVCTECGFDSPKWSGKCPSCGRWNTMKEITVKPQATQNASITARKEASGKTDDSKPHTLGEIQSSDYPRIDMHDDELNRVLGGGLVQGSLVLLGGEPGIGKSTLTLQTVMRLEDLKVLYVSGEESARQIKMRAERLASAGGGGGLSDNLLVLCETSLENIYEQIKKQKPELVVIDSIQTISSE